MDTGAGEATLTIAEARRAPLASSTTPRKVPPALCARRRPAPSRGANRANVDEIFKEPGLQSRVSRATGRAGLDASPGGIDLARFYRHGACYVKNLLPSIYRWRRIKVIRILAGIVNGRDRVGA
jgi:hypothetical protein